MRNLPNAMACLLAACSLTLLPACETMQAVSEIGARVGQEAGVLTPQQSQSVKQAVVAVGQTFAAINPEQEYYLGRTVAAVVLNRYRSWDNPEANHYLNILGQTLAQFSDRPETFGGYHFLILDTAEVNAFAAPGGLIFVSRGMLRCCQSEDALAAVLAHEIGHVEKQHGVQAIKKSRLTSSLTLLATEGAKSFGGAELAQLTEDFAGSVQDITSTLMNSGYARASERQADQAALQILQRAGYDPRALVSMLAEMKKHLQPGGLDFAKTHPAPDVRIAELQSLLAASPASRPAPPARQARFRQALAKL
ncbi:MAG: M48 family metalloprotease [Lentisphaerae bacterium]|nr:M48 family metalloprotease [Lentisphaerota bacterium]